jgi:DNA-binding transcriptional regulator YiaG
MTAPVELRFGYTLADLHAMAKLAVHTAGVMAADWQDRFDTAWSAIAEELYAAPHWPRRSSLVQAGQLAVKATVDEYRQAYGYYRRKTDGAVHGLGSSPAFRSFWLALSKATPGPEHRVVERLAAERIFATLKPRFQAALLALAAHEDYADAAQALGVKYDTFCDQVARGRRAFYALWHEGEEPSRVWGCDRRAGATSATRSGGEGKRVSTSRETIRRRKPAAGRACRSGQAETVAPVLPTAWVAAVLSGDTDRIRAERLAAGLSQRVLAELVGVSQGAVSLWEAGACPQPRVRQALEALLVVSVG